MILSRKFAMEIENNFFRACQPSKGFEKIYMDKGPFIYYVTTFLGFLDPPPPYVSMFLVLKISKS